MSIVIDKLLNETYKVRVWAKHKDVFGRRRTAQKIFTSVIAARRWADEAEGRLSEDVFNRSNNNMTFAELHKKYHAEHPVAQTTDASLKYVCPRIIDFLGMVKIKNMISPVVQEYINWLQKQPNTHHPKQKLSHGSVQKHFVHIRAVLNWGVMQGYLQSNPLAKVEITADTIDFEPTVINGEQIAEVLNYLKKEYYNLYIPVLICATIGSRRGESLGIKWDAIDFIKKTIDIRNNRTISGSKISDSPKLKTPKSKRLIAVSDFVIEALKEHQKMNIGLDSEYICANVFTGEVPTNPSYVTKAFHKILKNQFGIKMRLHDLRGSFNQLLYEAGADDTTRIQILGHGDIKINRRYYTKKSYNKEKAAMNAVANAINVNENVNNSANKT